MTKSAKKPDIPIYPPYNPLDKRNIGNSVAAKMIESEVHPLPPAPFIAAGVYALYYMGDYYCYEPLTRANQTTLYYPIYVGKAIPSGGRKGNRLDNADPGKALYKRLKDHAHSIEAANNLQLDDFRCRFISVDDIWIPLTETLLIEKFCPVWNLVLDGFGNHNPGKGRKDGDISSWDCVHPGRKWSNKTQSTLKDKETLEKRVIQYLEAYLRKT
jgi:hypothetical protein